MEHTFLNIEIFILTFPISNMQFQGVFRMDFLVYEHNCFKADSNGQITTCSGI